MSIIADDPTNAPPSLTSAPPTSQKPKYEFFKVIQKYLEDPLAEEILNMSIKNGDVLVADLDKENAKIRFTLKEKAKEKSEA